MSVAVPVDLPGGRWLAGGRDTSALVRPLTSADEVALLDVLPRQRHPAMATDILVRCVAFSEGDGAAEIVRGLTVGDREALLWHVRRLSVGEPIDATIVCASCHDKATVELVVSDLLHDPYPSWAPTFVERIAGHMVELRLPTGSDQEQLAQRGVTEPEAAVETLLARCVVAVDGAPASSPQLSGVADAVSERLAALDPQAEALLTTTCPSCGEVVEATLDAAAFLIEEVARRASSLLAHVHVIACAYGWSESDIVAMTPDRRQRYLDLIAEEHVAQAHR